MGAGRDKLNNAEARITMATIKDIAQLSGVSIGSVSYVINNQQEKVSLDKRERVLAAIRQLNYRPRQSLRRDMLPDSLTLGITSAVIDHSGEAAGNSASAKYFGAVVEGLLKACDNLGHNATVFATRLFREDPMLSIRTYCDGQCAGLIVVAPSTGNHLVEALQNRAFPFVIFGDTSHEHVSYCDLDNTLSARLATEKLLDLGHTRIGYCSGPCDMSSQIERLEGFRQALAARDIPFEERFISTPMTSGPSPYIPWMEGILDLPQANRPTAILCFSDYLAMELMEVIKRGGLRVPEDFSLIGFDDVRVDHLDPPLSSVRQPFEALTLAAVNLLIGKIHDPHSKPQRILLPGETILRPSVASIQNYR